MESKFLLSHSHCYGTCQSLAQVRNTTKKTCQRDVPGHPPANNGNSYSFASKVLVLGMICLPMTSRLLLSFAPRRASFRRKSNGGSIGSAGFLLVKDTWGGSGSPERIQARRNFLRLQARLSSTTGSNDTIRPLNKQKFVPRKAAVTLSEQTRVFFKDLLADNPEKDGIMLHYKQSSTGEPRMVFSFAFVVQEDIGPDDEGVSLELDEEGKPKSPKESLGDGIPKLYVHHNAFLKVLGAKLEVDLKTLTPILYDREGNVMDPNS